MLFRSPIIGSSAGLGVYGTDLKRVVCQIAAYDLMVLRGFNPNGEADQNYADRAKMAKAQLLDSTQGRYSFDVVDSSPGAVAGQDLPTASPAAYSPAPLNAWGTQTRGVDARMGGRGGGRAWLGPWGR